jgi:hypothetical protein
MSSNVSGPPESNGVVSDAIKSQAEKIARLLPGLPHPAERAILEEHFHNYSRETFDRVLEELGAVDTPVHEWKFAYVAFCRAIDDCYAAEALLSQGNSQEALEHLLTCATSLGVYEGVRLTSYLRAKKGGSARHKDSSQQVARNIVRECWDAWQISPENYKTQSEFAFDMLTKVPLNDRGAPAVSFDTILKKWIPAWTREKK